MPEEEYDIAKEMAEILGQTEDEPETESVVGLEEEDAPANVPQEEMDHYAVLFAMEYLNKAADLLGRIENKSMASEAITNVMEILSSKMDK